MLGVIWPTAVPAGVLLVPVCSSPERIEAGKLHASGKITANSSTR